jgi:hypothetical protein
MPGRAEDEAGVGVPHLERREEDVERDRHQHGREHVREERAEGERLLARESEAGEAVAGQRRRHHVEHDGARRRDQAIAEINDELAREKQIPVIFQRQIGAEERVRGAEQDLARSEAAEQHPVERKGDHRQHHEQQQQRAVALERVSHRPTSTSRVGSRNLK